MNEEEFDEASEFATKVSLYQSSKDYIINQVYSKYNSLYQGTQNIAKNT